MQIRQAVILAGGRGTRLAPFTDTAPKPMYPFQGEPFLAHLIKQVKSFGIQDIVLLLGYLPEVIIRYFGDGSAFRVRIRYRVTPVEWDTGSRLRAARDLLEEHILLLYCDNYCPILWDRAVAQYEARRPLLQLTVYENDDGYTKSNLRVSADGQVLQYDKARQAPDLHGVDIGYILMRSELIDRLPPGNVSFERELYPALVAEGKMDACVTPHRYYSVGSWARIGLTEEFFRPKRILFLDRDGTLNRRPPPAEYITSPEEFVWLEGAREAVALLKAKGYAIYLVTNQPGIARHMVTWDALNAIHDKMRRELREAGGDIDDIFLCPHGWDEGCGCRKPKPGLLYQAQKKHSLDLTKCWLIGDDDRDIEAGKAAGCQCLQVTPEHNLLALAKQLPLEEGDDALWNTATPGDTLNT